MLPQDRTTAAVRFDQIDALRGLAALMVVIHHAWVHAGRYRLIGTGIFDYGYIGVDLFLVLSGFCLSWPYLREGGRPFRTWPYVRRRFWRIYPPYFITFVGLAMLGWAVRRFEPASNLDISRLNSDGLIGGLTLQLTALNHSFWSLVLELRWYLICPVFVLWAQRASILPCLISAAVVAAISPAGGWGGEKIVVYLPVFLGGVWAAQCLSRPEPRLNLKWLSFGLIVSVAAMCALLPGATEIGRYGWREALPAGAMFSILLCLAIRNDSPAAKIAWPLERIGVFSFTLYLIHEPLIHLLAYLLPTQEWSPMMRLLFWQLGFVPTVIGLAGLLYHVIEKPFVRATRPRPEPPIVAVESIHPGKIA